jgi:putative PEP-CTERM system histidine kinase
VNTFGFIGYGVAFAGFAGLSMLLAFALRGRGDAARRLPTRLLVALGATSLWALVLALDYSEIPVPSRLVLAAELLRAGAWVYALLGLAPATLPRFLIPTSYLVWGLWAAASLAPVRVEAVMSAGGFCVALLVLLLLEQIYRNAPERARGDLKFLAIGIGGLFVYDLFLYAQALLLEGLDGVSWHARGLANVLLLPLLMLGARRLPDTDLRIFVSRQVTFYTTSFLAAGIYLLLMSTAGYAIREFGGAWGETARAFFLLGAFALLVVLVTSAALRRRLRVFVAKHFYRNKYDYRVEWLRFIKTLSASQEEDLHRTSVQAVAQTLGAPGGVLFTLDAGGRRLLPRAGWPMSEADRLPQLEALAVDGTLVEFMRTRRWIVDLHEYRERPGVYESITVPAWLAQDARWRIVSPVFRLDALVGVFVLLDPPPPFELSFEDRDLLHTMGQHVATMLAQHEADQRIAELSQFETYNRLTAFVMHDLKNCAAQLSLVVGNAVKHRHNPEFIDDAIATIANTSERITRLIEHLSRRSTDARPHPPVKLADVVCLAIERCRARRPRPRFEQGADSTCMVAAEREQLAAAVEHVLRNAQDATSESGDVTVNMINGGEQVRLTVRDDGVGMDAQFVQQQLFRPFHSTKGSKGMGIGAYQARELARSLGGDVEVESKPGAGTQFSFILPVAS